MTVVPQEVEFVAESVTVTPIVFVPNGKVAVNVTLAAAGGLLAGMEFVCVAVPLTDHTTLRASPSGSDTSIVSSVGTLHGTTLGPGQVNKGGWLVAATAISWPRISPLGKTGV